MLCRCPLGPGWRHGCAVAVYERLRSTIDDKRLASAMKERGLLAK